MIMNNKYYLKNILSPLSFWGLHKQNDAFFCTSETPTAYYPYQYRRKHIARSMAVEKKVLVDKVLVQGRLPQDPYTLLPGVDN